MSVLCLVVLLGASPAKVEFDYPIYLTVGPDRSIYVADQYIPAIYRIGQDGSVATLYKGKKQYRTPLYRPRGLALDPAGNVIVCDPATMDVFRVTPKGEAIPLTGKKTKLLNGIETTMGELVQPEGVAVGADGSIYVTDLKLRAVFKIQDGKPVKVADVPAPRGIAIDKDGTLVVVSHSSSQLKRVNPSDGKVTDIVQARPFSFPLSVCVRADGQYVVTDNYSKALWLVTREGKASKLVEGEPLKNPTGLSLDKDGNLAIADPHKKQIFWLSPDKKFTIAAEAK